MNPQNCRNSIEITEVEQEHDGDPNTAILVRHNNMAGTSFRQHAPTPSSSNLLPRTSTLRRRASEPTSVLEAFLQRSHHPLPYTSATPQVTYPRDIQNVPIEWLDNEEGVSNLQRSRSLHGPIIEEINNAIDTRAMSGHASFSVVEEPTSDVIMRPILNPFGTQNSTRVVDANDSCNPNAPIVTDISESNDKT